MSHMRNTNGSYLQLHSGFKFLPVLGKYIKTAMQRSLPQHLAQRWRFRKEYKDSKDVFEGDGSRGGPVRREFTAQEKACL